VQQLVRLALPQPLRELLAAADDAAVVVVRAAVPALDELVAGVVRSGIAVRELAPLGSPLESAFLALTESQEAGR
jgi:ABC-2 type transport system ATP-binding protein